MTKYDLLITNVRVVRPDTDSVEDADVAIKDGRFVAVQPGLDASDAAEVYDGGGKLAFPGAVDSHMHWGIYRPLNEEATTESRAMAQGGVTTGLTYIRTGHYYLNKGGDYADFYPEVLSLSEGNSYVDYGYHVAPLQSSHLDEIEMMIDRFGVPSFKGFMFYGGYGLHGASDDQSQFLMTPPGERYDYAHFEFMMRAIQAARESHPDIADRISLSLHCESAEIMNAYTRIVQAEDGPFDLESYHRARPPHSEGLAVTIAAYLAHEAALPNINLLHLSSAKALDAAMRMQQAFPHIDFRREVTVGHLMVDFTQAAHLGAKVNPPIRPRADVEALWEAVLAGDVAWVGSDHANCPESLKFGQDAEDVFQAKSGFGGTEYFLPALVGEGHARGMSYPDIAKLTSWNASRRYGLGSKGTIAVGYDADVAIVDPDRSFIAHAEDSFSSQEYSALEGIELKATVTDTFLRGMHILKDGNVIGGLNGRYQHRPTETV